MDADIKEIKKILLDSIARQKEMMIGFVARFESIEQMLLQQQSTINILCVRLDSLESDMKDISVKFDKFERKFASLQDTVLEIHSYIENELQIALNGLDQRVRYLEG